MSATIYDEDIVVEGAEQPTAFVWRGQRHEVRRVVGRWTIEGTWWSDGKTRTYWRVVTTSGSEFDLYHREDGWTLERLWPNRNGGGGSE